MASFNDFEGIPAHINRYLLNDLLREEWGFKGFITSDYEGINECVNHGIGDIEEVTALAIEASVDMDLNGSAYMDNLENLVKQGRLSEKILRWLVAGCWKPNTSWDSLKTPIAT